MFGRKKDQEEVGLGLDAVPAETGLEPGADMPAAAATPAATGTRVTAQEIQQKQFTPSRKGYAMTEVDEFLDLITEEVVRLNAEVKRLSGAGAAASAGLGGGDAEAIKAKARAEADAILADARSRAAAMTGGTGADPASNKAEIGGFLAQERTFLHSIAGMIQEHAETIRGMAKAAKDATDAAPAASAGGEAATETSSTPAAADAGDGGDTGSTPPVVTPPTSTSAWSATAPEASASPVAVQAPPEPTIVQIPTSDVDAPTGEQPPLAMADGAGGDEQDAPEAPDGADNGQRSLRELFWGED